MNKKKLNRVTALYRDGASPQTCVSALLEMSTNNIDASAMITRFFRDTWLKSLQDELQEERTFSALLARQLEEANKLLEASNESCDREKPSLVED